jgi:hypothetical protein
MVEFVGSEQASFIRGVIDVIGGSTMNSGLRGNDCARGSQPVFSSNNLVVAAHMTPA